MNFLIFDQVDW